MVFQKSLEIYYRGVLLRNRDYGDGKGQVFQGQGKGLDDLSI